MAKLRWLHLQPAIWTLSVALYRLVAIIMFGMMSTPSCLDAEDDSLTVLRERIRGLPKTRQPNMVLRLGHLGKPMSTKLQLPAWTSAVCKGKVEE
jgi:hypothetical protein